MNTEYEINNIIIEKIYKSDKDREGKLYMSKDKVVNGVLKKGSPFIKVDIYIDPRTIDDPEFQGKLTYFDYFENTNGWVQSMPITGKIVVKESNGRKYFNFELPPKEGGKKALELDIKELDNRLKVVEERLEITTPRKEVWNTMKETTTPKDALDFSKKVLEPAKEEDLDDGEDSLPF